MKKITLEGALFLHTGLGEVTVDPQVSARARLAVERMIEISRRPAKAA